MDSGEASRIGDIFQSVAKVEKPRVITPKPRPDDPEEPKTVIAEADGWKYLGGVFEPSINFALVEINGSQRMLKEGMKLAELNAEVISVEEGKIEINRNGKREQITLSQVQRCACLGERRFRARCQSNHYRTWPAGRKGLSLRGGTPDTRHRR